MKAIKFFIHLFFIAFVIKGCKPTSQAANKLDESTKQFFEQKNGASYTFTNYYDTAMSFQYTVNNYVNNQANPDIENNEIISYDLTSPGKETITIRCESGGTTYKDRIAMLTKINDTIVVGPIIFNLAGQFSPSSGNYDSVFQYPTYSINGKVFEDVIRIKLHNHIKYKEIFYSKYIGLIRRDLKDGNIYYLKKYKSN